MTIIVAIITIIMILIMIKHDHHDYKFIRCFSFSQGWWFHDFPRIFHHFFIWHPKANYANVAALTADALMNTCPWDYWVPAPGANGSTQLQLRPAAGKATCFSSGISGKPTVGYRKSPFLMGKSTISMAIFNSYVSLPEGKKQHATKICSTFFCIFCGLWALKFGFWKWGSTWCYFVLRLWGY